MMGMMGLGGMGGMGGMPGMGGMGGMPGGMMGMMGMDDSSPVVLVSNLNAEVITANDIQTLFGVYGDVHRVKILFNKKDTALVQFATGQQAKQAIEHLNKVDMFGKEIVLRPSKYRDVEMPRGVHADAPATPLSVDYTDMPVHRFKIAGSKNERHIVAPSSVLHVSSVADGATEQQLTELFAQYGAVTGVQFFKQDRHMALVGFRAAADAVVALIRLHNFNFQGKHIRVAFSGKPLAATAPKAE